jgi:N-acetylmuramoyl-L-alanine amidase
MIYTYNRAESIELARSICRTINRNLNTEILGIKGARFEVLRGVRMPAVLVEIGFLSNSREEKMLKNSYYRQKIAESIIEGIKYYAQGLALIRTARQ